MQDYVARALELGEQNIWTTNHGTGGDIFEAKTLADNNNLHAKFGMEGYIVPDPYSKDNNNYHIVLIPKTNIARKKLNKTSSRAHIEGYYYRPRFFLDDLLDNFNDDELYITTACIGGLLKNDCSINEIFYPLYEKYQTNLFLEIQPHLNYEQIAINQKANKFHHELGLPLIAANDSHYIYPKQAKDRADLQKGRKKKYAEDETFILDYPDIDTFYQRFIEQNFFTPEQISTAINNTLVFDDCEDIYLDKEIKMPSIYNHLNEDEKIDELKQIINVKFKNFVKQNKVPKDKRQYYKQEIKREMQVIEDTKEIHTSDYFLLNNKIVELSINKYGGVLTRSGRGSCGAELINKILGITQIDRTTINLPIYPERFMSTARLLENHALPDIDYNCAKQEPFINATRELLGDNNCYKMVAYGTQKLSEAFRNVCRAKNIDYDEFNEVAKTLDTQEPTGKWIPIVEEAKKYIGIITSVSPHPCAVLISNQDIQEEIGVVRIGDELCCLITSSEADEYKYLKNDYLKVIVWEIISDTFKEINQPILTVEELIAQTDQRTWNLLADGYTATLNQVDGDWATNMLMQFKPQSLEELSMFVGAIRPSFENFREQFLQRKPYTTGSKDLDNLFAHTHHYIIFQENLMQYFEWLGVSPAESIGLIKKISKKKIKPDDFLSLEQRLETNWELKTGSKKGFRESWDKMQAMMGYGFNSPHGVATALDCMYGAYLKVNYPLEYYTTVLNIYQDNQSKISAIENELPHFNINILPIKFGRSTAHYSYDKKTNNIYKGAASVKYVNETASNALYEFSKHFPDDKNFVDLLFTLKKEKLDIDSRMLKALITLDYFSEYGGNAKLLKFFLLFTDREPWKLSIISKSKAYPFPIDLLKQTCVKETAKQYRFDNMYDLYSAYFNLLPDESLTAQEQLVCEIMYLNSPVSTYSCEASNYMVLDYSINYGTPKAVLYNINTGETVETKIDKKIAFDQSNKFDHKLLFNKYSIISVPEISQKNRFKKNQDGTFTKLDSMENIIRHFVLVRKWEDTELIQAE